MKIMFTIAAQRDKRIALCQPGNFPIKQLNAHVNNFFGRRHVFSSGFPIPASLASAARITGTTNLFPKD